MENTELKVAEEAAWMARGEWAHVYVWQSPFAVHLELSQHCWSATLQYKTKSFFFLMVKKKEKAKVGVRKGSQALVKQTLDGSTSLIRVWKQEFVRNSSDTSDLLHTSSGHRSGSHCWLATVGWQESLFALQWFFFSPQEMLLLVAGRKQKIGFFQSRNFSTLISKNIGYYI